MTDERGLELENTQALCLVQAILGGITLDLNEKRSSDPFFVLRFSFPRSLTR